MTYDEIYQQLENIKSEIETNWTFVKATELGLDSRCGYVWVDENRTAIASDDTRILDYYGGFEYVDKNHILQVGNMKVYSGECDRVQRHLNNFRL